MLRHLGFMENAAIIENALLFTLEKGVHTGDFGQENTKSVSTDQFAETIISNFGKLPTKGAKPVLPNTPVKPTLFQLDKNPMLVSEEIELEKIVGVDFFIESN